jgi:hypothetical protein
MSAMGLVSGGRGYSGTLPSQQPRPPRTGISGPSGTAIIGFAFYAFSRQIRYVETGVNEMRNRAWLAAVAFLVLAGSPAWADDKSACLAGIKAIKAAMARHPPKPESDQLKEALDSAEQEVFEGDWDECVAAIRKVKLPDK